MVPHAVLPRARPPRPSFAPLGPAAVRAAVALVLGVALALSGASTRAAADAPATPRRHARQLAARRGADIAPGARVSRAVRPRWPGLAAPAFRGEARGAWKPAPAARLRFDAQRAWWELAALLEVLPTLPRLDGTPPRAVDLDAISRAVIASLTRPGSTPASVFRDMAHGADPKAVAAPDAGMRRLGSRLLRTLGLGSIAGEAVFVLEGAVSEEDEADALALAALPPRPWESPDPEGPESMRADALRSARGRGAMGVSTRVTLRSAALRLVGTF